ncbi:hypothetical protein [Blastococcus sp. SYSU D00820]
MTTPASSRRVFFSFPRITDPARHRDYNQWHQYDHRPENLALPGVVHGDRWVRSPDCAAAGSAPDDVLAGTHYLAMYWFAEPVEASVAEWLQLGDTTLQQGRRPELRYAERPLTGFFRPVRAHLAPRTRISAAALPFRPHTGVHVTVTAVADAGGADAEEHYAWEDAVALPALLDVPGVAGGWTFRSERVHTGPPSGGEAPDRPTLRLRLLWLDGDPLEVAARIGERERAAPAPRPETVRVLLSCPYRTIVPGEWSWFDAS